MEEPILQSHSFIDLFVHPSSIHVKLKKRTRKKVDSFRVRSKIITQWMEREKDASGMAQSEQELKGS